MPLQTPFRRLLAGLVLAGALLGACGGSDDPPAGAPESIDARRLPEEVLGLTVTPEETESLVEGRTGTYVSSIGLWGLREGTRLQATLQIADFNEEGRPEEEEFRATIASQVAGRTPQAYKMGNQTVYVTAASRQGVAIWFLDESMYVLSTRSEYEQPRALLRALVEGVL